MWKYTVSLTPDTIQFWFGPTHLHNVLHGTVGIVHSQQVTRLGLEFDHVLNHTLTHRAFTVHSMYMLSKPVLYLYDIY